MKEFQLQTPYGFEVRCSLEIIPEQHHIQVYDWDEENGWEPWATATVQIGGLGENEVAIKNYSENKGILEALVGLGVINPPHRRSTAPAGSKRFCNDRYLPDEPG